MMTTRHEYTIWVLIEDMKADMNWIKDVDTSILETQRLNERVFGEAPWLTLFQHASNFTIGLLKSNKQKNLPEGKYTILCVN